MDGRNRIHKFCEQKFGKYVSTHKSIYEIAIPLAAIVIGIFLPLESDQLPMMIESNAGTIDSIAKLCYAMTFKIRIVSCGSIWFICRFKKTNQ